MVLPSLLVVSPPKKTDRIAYSLFMRQLTMAGGAAIGRLSHPPSPARAETRAFPQTRAALK
jgi:hypothetical protein